MLNTDWRTVYIEPKASTAIIETIVLSLLGILLGYCFMPDAPYFSGQGFSWLMLGPALSGLRYGFTYAINSLILIAIIGGIAQINNLPWAQGSPVGLGLSLLFVAVVAGEFRNYWHRRIKKLNAAAVYLNERVSELGHAFNVLKHSHDRLEQIVASQISLRDSILNVRRQILLSHTNPEELSSLGLLILRSLTDLGSLQGASLHAYNAKENTVSPQAVACIGKPVALNTQNPLLLKSLATRKTVSLKLDLIPQHEKDLLLVIPLIDVHDTLFGVVAVNKMPFRAFREDNIQLLCILAGYIGDLLGPKLQPEHYIEDENLLYFFIQSMRCIQDITNYNLSASLFGVELKNKTYTNRLLTLITHRQRGLDQLVLLENRAGNPVALFILPLTDQRGIEGYLASLRSYFKTEFGVLSLAELGFYHVTQVLSADKSLADAMQPIADRLQIDNIFLSMRND